MSTPFFHVDALEKINTRKPTYLAIGSFDGVHLGHQAILKQLVQAAQHANVQTAVLTFFPHPKRVVQKLTGPYYLSTLEERIACIKNLGINLLITHPFNKVVRQTTADDFIDQLMNVMALKQLWGGDFALGYNRQGDVPYLRKLGEARGFTVESTAILHRINGRIVSSSRIRDSLSQGHIQEVTACLGRPYQLSGPVITGDQRGRTIGFPTANLDVWPEQLLPQNGVYAAVATVDDQRFLAATNIGTRPTVDGNTVRVEAYLLDFDENIYGKQVQLQLLAQLRQEQKFGSLAELQAQIKADVEQVRQFSLDT